MARLVQSILALVSLIGFSQAFTISEFKSISKDKGVLDAWIELEPISGHNENDTFGLAYTNDKLYMIGKRSNGTALSGGIVSTLDKNGDWKHAPFNQLDDNWKQLDIPITLAGRLLLLTFNGRDIIVINKLFVWDDDHAKWNNITLDIPDKDNVFQKLVRGPNGSIGTNIPDPDDGNIMYIALTDHEFSTADSETSFIKMELFLDNSTARITLVNRVVMDTVGKAVLGTTVKEDRLYALAGTFSKDNNVTLNNITIDFAINLINGSVEKDIHLDYSASLPAFYFNGSKIIEAKDMVLFIGPPPVVYGSDVDFVTRHVWELDVAQMKFQEIDASFPNIRGRAFKIDRKNMRLLTADPKKGAYAAVISL